MTTISAKERKMPTICSIIAFTFLFSSMSTPVMSNDQLAYDLPPFIKVYRDGRIERLRGTAKVPPSLDSKTGVQSKDIVISHEKSISARLYLPHSITNTTHKKLPLVVYFHGGAFCIESASSPNYHNYLNSLVAKGNVVCVSVDYRLAPEHHLPVAYDDSWAALKWVATNFGRRHSEEWLTRYADPQRVFLYGDSAGANIAHHMGLKVGSVGLKGAKVIGIVLVHPFFWGTKPIGAESTRPQSSRSYNDALWRFLYPSTSGSDDPLFNPAKDPKLGALGCEKVLVCVAEKDVLKDRGLYYSKVLKKSGWKGVVEVMESKGETHVFHLSHPTSDKAVAMLKKIVSFINN